MLNIRNKFYTSVIIRFSNEKVARTQGPSLLSSLPSSDTSKA